ncbi:MAG: hypothetical protein AAFW89_11780 [Bacteroidota bacterium]
MSTRYIIRILILVKLLLFSLYSNAQQGGIEIPKIETPKPATFGQVPIIGFQRMPGVQGMPSPFLHQGMRSTNPLAVWQNDQAYIALQKAQLDAMFRELNYERTISYRFSSKDHLAGVNAYRQAYEELRSMLDGETPLDLKKAIFTVENAYFNNQGSFEEFDQRIKDLAQLTSDYIDQQGWDRDNPVTPLLAVHKLFSDTLEIEQAGLEEAIIHYPIEYDFNDFWGRDNLANVFVSKILATGSGQCYSMPQLYLLLVEELGGKAWLSFSPNHSYVKFKDEQNEWYNLELTNGNLVSENWMMASGYVSTETIQNGLYMDTLSVQETIASKLVDLALGFGYKYGYDEFVIQAIDKALEHHPENIGGILTKANYYTELVKHIAGQMGNPTNDEYLADPYARSVLVMRERMYQLIDNTGYKSIPADAYTNWLNSLDEYQAEQKKNNATIKPERTKTNR